MEDQKDLQSNSQTLIDEFVRFREAYSNLKAQNATQKELLRLQKTEIEASRSIAEAQRIRMSNLLTVIATKRQKESDLLKVQEENKRLVKLFEELQRNYDNLRSSTNEYVEQIRRDNEKQICKLEEELEVVRAQLALQEERHQDDMKLQEQKHRENINSCILKHKGKLLITDKIHQLAERKRNIMIQRCKKTIDAGNKQSDASLFRWPNLDITKTKKNSTPKKKKKSPVVSKALRKKKLYNLDNETTIDII